MNKHEYFLNTNCRELPMNYQKLFVIIRASFMIILLVATLCKSGKAERMLKRKHELPDRWCRGLIISFERKLSEPNTHKQVYPLCLHCCCLKDLKAKGAFYFGNSLEREIYFPGKNLAYILWSDTQLFRNIIA